MGACTLVHARAVCVNYGLDRLLISLQVYEKLTGVKVEGKLAVLNKEDVLKSLPSEWPEDPIEEIHALETQNNSKILVVLDDDPTGTQTVHDIEVLTEW